ncbi:hypothetical protein FZC84_21315 [Rossellomorea vietnamensis]|uniref:Uncharacterized protein n=1 Tax=Rossellomorea vietnamensis TaxID=218284 RepID=A0A5D4M1C1_9BACI|nr:hypothetical protein [Rossellomorea vietnamensis]TYR95734.1 hypothetical protein FZC84_21315 [Rossellomorea vietnamensis]
MSKKVRTTDEVMQYLEETWDEMFESYENSKEIFSNKKARGFRTTDEVYEIIEIHHFIAKRKGYRGSMEDFIALLCLKGLNQKVMYDEERGPYIVTRRKGLNMDNYFKKVKEGGKEND